MSRHIQLIAIAVFGLFTHVISADAQQPFSEVVRQAEDFAKKGDYREAVNDFNQALKLRENDKSALQGRASAKAMMKDYKGAIADYTTLLSLYSNDYSSLFERGKARLYDGDIQGALADFRESVNRSFKPAESNYWMGLAYFDQKDLILASEAFEKACSLDAKLKDAFYRGALVNAELEQYSKALQKLNPLIEQDSSNVDLYILRATVSLKVGKNDLASSDLEKISALKPGSADVTILSIMLKNNRSDYKGALADIDSMLQIYPNETELLYMERGKSLHHLDRYKEAVSMFEQAHAIKPQNTEVLQQWCLMHLDREEYRHALKVVNEALDIADQKSVSWYLKGRALMGLELADEAFVAIHQGLETDKEQPEAGYCYLGMVSELKGNRTQAKEHYSHAIKLNAAYAEAYYRRGLLNSKLKDEKSAEVDFRTASTLGHKQAQNELEALKSK